MNKQLINKYKPEFDYWLNGGKLLCYTEVDGSYYEVTDEKWDFVCDIGFIINDEFVEFRKAVAEGKTIQIYDVIEQHISDPSLDRFGWRDFKSFTPSSSFSKTPDLYRIKPDEPKFKIPAYFKELSSGIVVKFTEEISNSCFGIIVESSLQTPQKNKGFEWRCWDIFSHPERWEYLPNYNEPKFKVGDFVTPLNREINCSIWQIDKVLSCNTLVSGSTMLDPRTVQLWTPVKGEWCWFYDQHSSKSAALAQFKEMKGSYFRSNTDIIWIFCEPFLNSLPSYLKDK